jgi:hypothetical protein
MATKKYGRTFQAGAALTGQICMLTATCDELIAEGYEDFSVVDTFAPGHPNPDDNTEWWSQPYRGFLLVSASVLVQRSSSLRAVLSREGQVNIYGPGGQPDHTYQIPGAGVFGEAANGLGYVNCIRAVGDQLYVCGQSRQVYRFVWDGQNLASASWQDMAGPMRQAPISEPPEDGDPEALDRWMDENDAIDLVDIYGPAPDDLYAVGDEAWHWNGTHWNQLALPTDEPLAAITLLNPNEIILVGHNGTVLHGNARNGFQNVSSVDDNQNLTGVAWFEGKLFLASNFGLLTYNPSIKRLETYPTNLKPDLKDTHQLEAKDGVLWSFGRKDLAYCDGKTWTRVDHPDNPPIR